MKSKRVGVVMGGTTEAHGASRSSGEEIARALEENGHDTCLIDLSSAKDPVEPLRRAKLDVALLALSGSLGESGCIQGLLELLQIPYTGASVMQSALALDKLKAKELFRLHNVPTPAYYVFSGCPSRERIVETHGSFGFPAIVKPRRQGESGGVVRAADIAGLVDAIAQASRHDSDVLVERFIRGREVTVGLLHGRVLGALEIAPISGMFDADVKRSDRGASYHMPVRLSAALQRNVLNLAERAAAALDVRGAVRVDMIVTEQQNEYVLEVNTMPSLAASSPYRHIAEAAGFGIAELCESLLAHASLNTVHAFAPKKAEVVSLATVEDRGRWVAAG